MFMTEGSREVIVLLSARLSARILASVGLASVFKNYILKRKHDTHKLGEIRLLDISVQRLCKSLDLLPPKPAVS